jgi:hypothetical protein
MMNKHVFLDNFTATIGTMISGKLKFFSESIESVSFKDHIKSIKISIPEINMEGTYETAARTSAGKLDPAFRVEKWLGYDYPTIIYHHGNNERPFDYRKSAKNTFLNIFVKAHDKFRCNIIVVRSPFHNGSLKAYQMKVARLDNFMAMLSASTVMNECIIKEIRRKSPAPVITCGISLGGWITNLHRSFFNSSTAYIPLMAGTFLGELFLESKYRRLTSDLALLNPEKIRQLLNFNTLFDKVTDKNIYPVLALYDQFIMFNTQINSYSEHPVKSIEAGHVTGALSAGYFRKHILRTLRIMQEQEESVEL